MISIIIPVYNHALELKKCLASLARQTYQDFEVIVVDDGSQEDIQAVLPAKLAGRAVIYQRIAHSGANVARNVGFKAATGQYLLFLDADIVCLPQMLEKLILALKSQNNAIYAYASFKYGWKTFKLRPFSGEALKKANFIHTTSLIRREYFPGFDEQLKRFQDWDLWLTLLEQGRTGVWVPEILFRIKSHGSMSSWLPRLFYNLPWLKSVKKYKEAEKVIKEKHEL